MNCRIAKTLMQEAADGELKGADTGLINAHLEECPACREDYRQTLKMLESLRNLPVPPSSPGFAERVLKNATRSRPATAGERSLRPAAGIAASLLALFLLVTLMVDQRPEQQATDIVLHGSEVRTIRVAIESAQAVDGIRMTIDVSDNLAIEGYRDQREISWTARLEQGINLIALPVSAIADGEGEIVARVGLGEHEKVFRIRTRHQAPGNAGNRMPVLAAIESAMPERL